MADARAGGEDGAGESAPAAPVALVALGSNLGDPAAQLRRALTGLRGLGRIAARSSLWSTAPVGGPPGQPDYLNAVIALEPRPELTDPAALLAALLRLERAQGRVRRERWGARTLDLDLLDHGGRTLRSPGLTLPHPRMMERAFVLAPLCEVAPAWRHPHGGGSACAAFAALPASRRGAVRRTALRWDAAPARG